MLIATKSLSADHDSFELSSTILLNPPEDVPEGYIAYNPSAIWSTLSQGQKVDIVYVRVEPDRASTVTSHLGKSVVRPYCIDLTRPVPKLTPWHQAEEKVGEDPALTRVNRKLPSGKIQAVWLLSAVHVQPKPDEPNEVAMLQTRFYAGETLSKLEHIANGPDWMKDIRVAQGPDPHSAEIHVYGRPQPQPYSGNITFTTIASLENLNEQVISAAPFIDETLLPVGSGIWGGVNDIINAGDGKYILAAHRAWRKGDQEVGRHYEAVLYEHDTVTRKITELGVLATADMFPPGRIKDDASLDLHDVVFTGGGYNGTLQFMTCGVRDATIGLISPS